MNFAQDRTGESITPAARVDGLGWLGASMILVVDLPGVCPMLSIVQTTQPEMITIRYATFDFRRYFGNNRDRGDDRSSAVRPVRPGNLGRIHAADLSSLFSPRATILIASSGNGRCSALASFHGARIQTSRSPSVSRMTGIALG